MLRFACSALALCVGCSLSQDLDSLKGPAGGSGPGGGAAGASGGSAGSGGDTGGAGGGGASGSGGVSGGGGSGGSGGSVACDNGQTDCGGACVSTLSDPKHCGTCSLDCGAATCTNGVCGSGAVVSMQCHGVAVNGTTVYLTRYGAQTSSVAGLYQADVGPSASLPASATPVAVGSQYLGSTAVVSTQDSVFFAVHDGNAIFRHASGSTDPFFQSSTLGPWDLAVAGSTLYFTGKANHSVYRRVVSGATAAEVVLTDSALSPRSIAVALDRAYVTDDVAGKVFEIDTAAKAGATIWSAMDQPYGVAVELGQNNAPSVVVTRRNGADVLEKVAGVWTLFKLADAPSSTADLDGNDVAIAGGHAYWTLRSTSAGRLMRRRVDRSEPALVMWSSDAADAGGVATTSSHVYFCTGAELRRIRIGL